MKTALHLFLFVLLSVGTRAQNIEFVHSLDGRKAYNIVSSALHDGSLYFTTYTPQHLTLWKSDGTTSGTVLLHSWDSIGYSLKFTAYNNKLYFIASDRAHGFELWTSNGMSAGTVMVSDVSPGAASTFFDANASLKEFNGNLYFVNAQDDNGVWKTDGTAAGTQPAFYFGSSANPFFAGVGELEVMNGSLYFVGILSMQDFGIYKTDGSTTGTEKVMDGTLTNNLIPYNGKLYFNTGLYGAEPIGMCDGTLSGSFVSDSALTGFNNNYIGWNGMFYFFTEKGSLYATDGTRAGTGLLNDSLGRWYHGVSSQRDKSNQQAYPVLHSGKVYFTTNGSIWQSDGSAAGTRQIKVIAPEMDPMQGYLPSLPSQLTSVGANLYFKAIDTSRVELYISDGTEAGTHKVLNRNTNVFGNPNRDDLGDPIMVYNNQIFYTATYDSAIGKALYKINAAANVPGGEGTGPEVTLYPNPNTGSISIRSTEQRFSRFTMYNAVGQQVWSELLPLDNLTEHTVNTTRLSAGMYTIRLTGEHTVVKPIVIVR